MMGKLIGSLCKCGQVLIPKQNFCITCSKPIEDIDFEISDNGNLISFTTLKTVPEGFTSPLILGIVELIDEKFKDYQFKPKLICQGRPNEWSENELLIGMSVIVEMDNYIFTFRKKG
jgi:uncharacterized OB-fold protein